MNRHAGRDNSVLDRIHPLPERLLRVRIHCRDEAGGATDDIAEESTELGKGVCRYDLADRRHLRGVEAAQVLHAHVRVAGVVTADTRIAPKDRNSLVDRGVKLLEPRRAVAQQEMD